MVSAARVQLPSEDLDLYSHGPPGSRLDVLVCSKLEDTKLGFTYKPWFGQLRRAVVVSSAKFVRKGDARGVFQDTSRPRLLLTFDLSKVSVSLTAPKAQVGHRLHKLIILQESAWQPLGPTILGPSCKRRPPLG